MAKAAARGESVEACIQKAEAIRRSTGLYFLVDTLDQQSFELQYHELQGTWDVIPC